MIFLFRACFAQRAGLGVAVPRALLTYPCGLRGEFGNSILRAVAGKTACDDAGKLRRRAPGGWRFAVQKAWLAQAWQAVVVAVFRDDVSSLFPFLLRATP